MLVMKNAVQRSSTFEILCFNLNIDCLFKSFYLYFLKSNIDALSLDLKALKFLNEFRKSICCWITF